MKKRVKFMVTLLLLSAMVLVPVSAFAASDRCSSCNSNNYNISCNASDNGIDDSVSRSDSKADYSTTCNNANRLNNATYNCSGNSIPQTTNSANCNASCYDNNNSNNCIKYFTNDSTSDSWLTNLKNYLLSYLQGYANSGLFASNGDDAIPVFKMNATDNTSDTLDDTYALEVINLVNQERVAAGLDELVIDEGLCEAAAVRAAEIQSLFSHTRPDGSSCFTALEDIGVQYTLAGENIAIGQASPQAVVQAWMESPGHRENILNPSFTRIGVASLANSDGNYGGYAWAQFFAN